MNSLSQKIVILLCSTLFASCGKDVFDNPYDPKGCESRDKDSDNINDCDDENKSTPDNPVVINGEKIPTKNLDNEWTFFARVALYASASEQAPDGYRLPTIAEVRDGLAAGVFKELSDSVWSSTVGANRDDYRIVVRLKDGNESDQWEKTAFKSLYIRD